VHSAIDAHTRLAYSEVHENEQATMAIAFWRRARAFFTSYGIVIERVMTDNGRCYVSFAFGAELVSAAIAHTKTKPYSPSTNGKVERYNRTLLNEWAYARPYRSEAARTRALAHWLHMYNHHRHHTAIGGPPVTRVNNLAGQNSYGTPYSGGVCAPSRFRERVARAVRVSRCSKRNRPVWVEASQAPEPRWTTGARCRSVATRPREPHNLCPGLRSVRRGGLANTWRGRRPRRSTQRTR
jgi:hypothetical protein